MCHIRDFKVHPFNEWSDHALLSINIICVNQDGEIEGGNGMTHVKWNAELKDEFRRRIIGQLPVFNRVVSDIHSSEYKTIDTCINRFSTLITDIAEPLFAFTTRSSNRKYIYTDENNLGKKNDWFDNDCRKAQAEYLASRNNFTRCKNTINRIEMCDKKKFYKQLVKRKKRLYEKKKCSELTNLRHAQPKSFWQMFSKKKVAVSQIINVSEFFDYFSKLQDELVTPGVREANQFCENFDLNLDEYEWPELNSGISADEVYKVVRSLKTNKACAQDRLLNEYFIESIDILCPYMVDIFNAILDSGYFPELWTKGVIVPLHKKNDLSNVSNYRGITLVSCFSKIFTGIINNRVTKWIESNEMLSDAQCGFRSGRSTVDAIFILKSIVDIVLNDKKKLFCCFVDLKKAFDSINLNNLCYKIYHKGLNGKLFRIIKNMYTTVKACVKGCNSYSDYFECAVGLKQGEVISPVLFSLFIDDLELFLQDDPNCGIEINELLMIVLLFADDMVILGNSQSDLQCRLNLLKEYCDKWGLQVNSEKNKVMVFRKRINSNITYHWTYGNVELEVVNCFNYLGTVFNYNGSFSVNQETLAGKGLKALNVLLNKLRSLFIKSSVQCKLFDAFVGSTMNYAAEVTGFGKCKEIERVHLKFCKNLLKVKQSTCSLAVYSELGRFPLFVNRYTRVIKYWAKVIQTDNFIIQRLYTEMLKQCLCGQQNWLINVKFLLDSYGFSHVFSNPHSINLETFHIIFKERVIDVFKQTWFNGVKSKSSLNLFLRFKNDIQFEKYLDILPINKRAALSRLRLSSHKLLIETGRYSNRRLERNERKCTFCDMNDLEDEYHFVLVCPLYADLRQKYIKKYFYKKRSVHKFIELMSTKNNSILKNLSKFVLEAFKCRSSLN